MYNMVDDPNRRKNARHAQSKQYDIDGVKVYDFGHFAKQEFSRADVVITHLEKGSDALHGAPSWCKRYGKPLVRIVHNAQELKVFRATKENTDLVVFNSLWMQQAYNEVDDNGFTTADWPQMVLPPPVDPDYYRVEKPAFGTGDITLINLTDNKGAVTFYRLAEAMPDRSFLGVIGGYDQQMIRRMPNVEIHPNTADIREVYRRTGILLMPSAIETWGRVAIEAMCSGIPVIAHPTNGLSEACGNAAIFCHRSKPEEWIKAIESLDDPQEYAKWSEKGIARAEQLRTDYTEFEQRITQLAAQRGKEMIKSNKISGDVEMKARRSFGHRGQRYEKSQVFITDADTAQFFASRNLADYVPKLKAPKAEPEQVKQDKKAAERETK